MGALHSHPNRQCVLREARGERVIEANTKSIIHLEQTYDLDIGVPRQEEREASYAHCDTGALERRVCPD